MQHTFALSQARSRPNPSAAAKVARLVTTHVATMGVNAAEVRVELPGEAGLGGWCFRSAGLYPPQE
jgi:hypothetical protein